MFHFQLFCTEGFAYTDCWRRFSVSSVGSMENSLQSARRCKRICTKSCHRPINDRYSGMSVRYPGNSGQFLPQINSLGPDSSLINYRICSRISHYASFLYLFVLNRLFSWPWRFANLIKRKMVKVLLVESWIFFWILVLQVLLKKSKL